MFLQSYIRVKFSVCICLVRMNLRAKNSLALALALTLALSTACSAGSGSPATDQDTVKSSSPQDNRIREDQAESVLGPGVWGGRSIRMEVSETSVVFEFDCADAKIPGTIKIAKDGKFSARGLYSRQPPGPIQKDAQPVLQPVQFDGKVVADHLGLQITLVETGESLGEFDMEKGRSARLFKCY